MAAARSQVFDPAMQLENWFSLMGLIGRFSLMGLKPQVTVYDVYDTTEVLYMGQSENERNPCLHPRNTTHWKDQVTLPPLGLSTAQTPPRTTLTYTVPSRE